jgi:hypothetical protein
MPNSGAKKLTFRNRASYIQDRHTATLQTPHFIYFFQQISVLNFLNMLHTLRVFLFKMPLFHNPTFFCFLYYSHFTYNLNAKRLINRYYPPSSNFSFTVCRTWNRMTEFELLKLLVIQLFLHGHINRFQRIFQKILRRNENFRYICARYFYQPRPSLFSRIILSFYSISMTRHDLRILQMFAIHICNASWMSSQEQSDTNIFNRNHMDIKSGNDQILIQNEGSPKIKFYDMTE